MSDQGKGITRAEFLRALEQIGEKELMKTFERDAQIVNLGGLVIEISGQSEQFMEAVQNPVFEMILDRVSDAMGFDDDHKDVLEFRITDKPNPNYDMIRKLCADLLPLLEKVVVALVWLKAHWDLKAGSPVGVNMATYELAASRFKATTSQVDGISREVERLGGKVHFPRLYKIAEERCGKKLEDAGLLSAQTVKGTSSAVMDTALLFNGRIVQDSPSGSSI